MTDIDASSLLTLDDELDQAAALPPEEPSLPPGEWIQKNLFSSPFNTILTFVFGAVALFFINILVDFVFSEERNWTAPATNLRLLMTQGYPESQYIRVWVSVGFIAALTGLCSGVWNAGDAISAKRISNWFMTTGTFGIVAGLLAPFTSSGRVTWTIVFAVLLAIGLGIWFGLGERRRTLFIRTPYLVYGAITAIIASLWVVPYGNYTFSDGVLTADSGSLVAMSTRQPWTILLLVLIGSYALGRIAPSGMGRILKPVLVGLWILAPFIIVWVILRDPDLDWDHVFSTDLPMALGFIVGGGAILYALTKPGLGEAGKLAGFGLLLFAVFHWLAAFLGLYPMLQKARLSFLFLALFALAAANFAGDRRTRLQLVWGWAGFMVIVHYIATMVNTASTLEFRGDFFLGGYALTLFVSIVTLMLSFPLGVLLALARTSRMPIFRVLSTIYIEAVRGVPLITILFFFSVILPLFLPPGMEIAETAAVVTGFTLFSAAYLAENVRGGLQSIRRGQFEAADALGLTGGQRTGFIVLPQALRVSIPPLVGQAIATYKETSLVAIVGLNDLTRIANSIIPAQSDFLGVQMENLLIISFIYWVGAFSMSKYSQKLERRLGVGER